MEKNLYLPAENKYTMHINLIVIKTSDIAATARFYESLGIHFEHHRHGQGPLHYAAVLDQVVFEIYPLKESEVADSTLRLGFTVSNLEQLIEEVRTQNIKIIKEPATTSWGYTCLLEDPDGRKVELKQADVCE
ncbi:MAG TPA: VOC family protein [Ohtaekwangia sp.]